MRLIQGSSGSAALALAALLLGSFGAPAVGQDPPAAPPVQDAAAAANRSCWRCHAESDDTLAFADGAEARIGVDKRLFLESAHGRLECKACHADLDVAEHTSLDRPTRRAYREQLAQRCLACHGAAAGERPEGAKAIARTMHSAGEARSPLCSDCHAPHAAARAAAIVGTTSRACAACHEDVYAAFAGSVHGRLGQPQRDRDVPDCADCHHGHSETGKQGMARRLALAQPCIGCHADADLMRPYDISTGVVSTYLEDFHGVSVRFYGAAQDGAGRRTLVCSDCHGLHGVARMSDESRLAMKQNLVQVCRECHADASTSFPDAWLSHYEPSLTQAPLVYLVKLSYWVLIPFVMLGLGLQIFAHLVLHPRRLRQAALAGGHAAAHGPRIEPGDDRRMVMRFGKRNRAEHLAVMLTFVLLLLTGLPQKFYDSGWALTVTSWFGGIDAMRVIHRVAGITFTAVAVVHLVLALWGVLSGRTGTSIVPGRKDFTDAVQNIKYYVGLADSAPRFDRYDYRQKFEYWGMIVGSAVMIGSGFVLYFPIPFADLLPGQLIPAAKAAHSYEAMMALLTIVIWHMYGAHLNPDCFPIDKSIFTGRISLARLKHEHGLEYERLAGRLPVSVREPASGGRTQPRPASDPAEPAPG